jgi:hypothetical protein
MAVESYKIENESDADEYLKSLLEKHEYRSIDEVKLRAQKYIKDERLKNYFITKAKAILQAGS